MLCLSLLLLLARCSAELNLTSCGSTKGCLSSRGGTLCHSDSTNCDAALTWRRVDEQVVEFELMKYIAEHKPRRYVAVAFAHDPTDFMRNSSVILCYMDSDGKPAISRAHNRHYGSQVRLGDISGLTLTHLEEVDRRLSCTFTSKINSNDSSLNFPLDTTLYLGLAAGDWRNESHINIHRYGRTRSALPILVTNNLRREPVAEFKINLMKAHAWLMTIGTLFSIVSISTAFKDWLMPRLRDKLGWNGDVNSITAAVGNRTMSLRTKFQLVIGILLNIAGMLCIKAYADWKSSAFFDAVMPEKSHAILGYVTVIFAIVRSVVMLILNIIEDRRREKKEEGTPLLAESREQDCASSCKPQCKEVAHLRQSSRKEAKELLGKKPSITVHVPRAPAAAVVPPPRMTLAGWTDISARIISLILMGAALLTSNVYTYVHFYGLLIFLPSLYWVDVVGGVTAYFGLSNLMSVNKFNLMALEQQRLVKSDTIKTKEIGIIRNKIAITKWFLRGSLTVHCISGLMGLILTVLALYIF